MKGLSKTSMACALGKGEINQNVEQCAIFPPAEVRGMKILDRKKFCKSIMVPCLTINEMRLCPIMKYIKKYLLKLDNFKPVQALEPSSHGCTTAASQCSYRKIVLNPTKAKCLDDIEEGDRSILQNFNISKESLKFEKIDLTYDNWRADELLKAVLPELKDSLTSYSVIGHVVHVNLRDHLLEYKHVIGQILLDKIKGARTVVNKTDIIDNTYRNFKMEILCGEDYMLTEVRENHCVFKFDFSSVYWNPRLCTEHERIIKKVKQGDILYDVFAGVGPFAIPAAKRKCTVLANDLNPESYKWLKHNAELLFTPEELHSLEIKTFPVVYLYCFTKGDNPVTLAKGMVEENLGVELKEDLLEIFHVRNVSVKKEMMRVTFMLSKSILIMESSMHYKSSRKCAQHMLEEPQTKRLCVEGNGEDYEKHEYIVELSGL
jgi:hypothetical protein